MAVLVTPDATIHDVDETLTWLSRWTHRDWDAIDALLDARLERSRG